MRSMRRVGVAVGLVCVGGAWAQSVEFDVGERLGGNLTFVRDVVVYDVDGDGLGDLVAAARHDLAWLRQQSDGSFEVRQSLDGASSHHTDVGVADVDGDGDADLVVASVNPSPVDGVVASLSWYETMSPGVAPLRHAIAGADVQRFALADFDGDGDVDLVAVNELSTAAPVFLYENLGGGTFAPPQQVFSVVPNVRDLHAADVDGDGDQDLVVAAHAVAWFENLGTGTSFIMHELFSSGTANLMGEPGDIDGDGDLDLVIATQVGAGDDLAWFEQEPVGVFATSHPIAITGNILDVQSKDLDGDGDPDIQVTRALLPARRAANDGAGNFGPAQFLHNASVDGVMIEDFSGDGAPDIVTWQVNDGLVFARRSLGSGSFESAAEISTPAPTFGELLAADVDGDGSIDLLTTGSFASGNAHAWWNDGAAFFDDDRLYNDLIAPGELGAIDIDADGDLDLVGASAWFRNEGARAFTAETLNAFGAESTAFGDVDGDGDLDSAICENEAIRVRFNRGDGVLPFFSFAHEVFWLAEGSDKDNDLVMLDVNADGLDDIVYVDGPSDQLTWFESNGTNENWVAHPLESTLDAPIALALGDLDGDGVDEVIVGHADGVSVLVDQAGIGALLPPMLLVKDVGAVRDVELVDVDADGDLDLVTANAVDGVLAWSANLGSGTFGAAAVIAADIPRVARVTSGDLDGNGLADIAYASLNSPEWGWYANAGGGAFVDLGQALAGAEGEPLLVGAGTLAADDPVSFVLADARGLAAASLVVGVDELSAPFKGGVLVPTPSLILSGFVTDAVGALTLSASWPAGLPSGFELYLQWWIADDVGPKGFAASNGLVGATP